MAPTTKRLLTGAVTTAVGLATLVLTAVVLRAHLPHPPAAQRAQTDAPSDAAEAASGEAALGVRDRHYSMVSEAKCADWCVEHGGVTGFVNYLGYQIPIHEGDDSDDIGAVHGGAGDAAVHGGADNASLSEVLSGPTGRTRWCATRTFAIALAKHNPGMAVGMCCCANTLAEPAAPVPELPAPVSCDEWCGAAGRGRGVMFGTAPFCEVSCHEDCHAGLPHGGTCASANNHGPYGNRYGLRDFGAECSSGNKMCCCAQHHAEGPPVEQEGLLTCERFCRSAGHARSFISGTAPACEGECFPHAKQCVIANAQFTDLGEYCFSGNKICNCY